MVVGTEVTGSQTVLYEKRDGVAWVTLNRPEVMNAQNAEFRGALARAMREASTDDEINVVVIIGAGGRAFSAGNDLKAVAAQNAAGVAPGSEVLTTDRFDVADCPKAVIAAIDGYALGGGLELSLRCDIRIATEKSRFGLPEVKRARTPGPGIVELHRMIPLGEAKWIQLTGAHMTAKRAYEIGLVQVLLPDRDALIAEAERLAGEIKMNGPLAVEAIKRVVNIGRSVPPEYNEYIRSVERSIIDKTEDIIEGARAFTEKRAPVYKRR